MLRGNHLWSIVQGINGARARGTLDGRRTRVPGELESRGVRRMVVESPIGRIGDDLRQGVGVGDRGSRSHRDRCANEQHGTEDRDENGEPRFCTWNQRQLTSGGSVDIHALMLPRTALAT